MSYVFYNPNPHNRIVGDCVVRAISRLLEKDWDTSYAMVTLQGFTLKDMPSSNDIWGACLLDEGFVPEIVPCQYLKPPCTVRQFADSHPNGRFLLFVGEHVVTVVNGDYYDTWDSGDKVPQYFWKEK